MVLVTMRRLLWFVPVVLLTVLLDQLSKGWARGALEPGVSHAVLGTFWHWRLSFNTGAAFSMGAHVDVMRTVFSVVGLLAVVVITILVLRNSRLGRSEVVAFALIAAGALGNVIDRIAFGHVTDFVLWKAFGHSWPVFNVADVALVAGVLLMLLAGLPRRTRAGASPA
jgi:signal peptidase II